jgi:hypothetical protein
LRGGDLQNWDVDRAEFCSKVESFPAKLKVLLKTKNDSILLERWIRHHLKIVGPKNIIVFDNMSDRQDVLSIYAKYANEIEVVQFSGFHNNVHRVEMFPEIYGALAKCSDFFIFLDTDEFLILINDGLYYSDERIIDFLHVYQTARVFPGTWLYNTNWNARQFICGTRVNALASGMAWGKPLLRSNSNFAGFINHNIQLDQSFFSVPYSANFFVLHLANLSPQQRIHSNVNKLIARGFAQPGDTLEEIAGRSIAGVQDSNIVQYVTEIIRLLPLKEQGEAVDGDLRAGCMEFLTDDKIRYYSGMEQNTIEAFISNPEPVYLLAARQFSSIS